MIVSPGHRPELLTAKKVLGVEIQALRCASSLDDLARRGACCEVTLWPQMAWKHLYEIDVSMSALGQLMEDFLQAYLPMVDSLLHFPSLKLRTALQQIFVLPKWKWTRADFRTSGTLGLFSSKQREEVNRFEQTTKETSRNVKPVHEKWRHLQLDAFTTGNMGSTPGRSLESSEHRNGICVTPGNGERFRDPNFDEGIRGMACRDQRNDIFFKRWMCSSSASSTF